jgi:epoxyqueuosine reductase
VIGGAAVAPLSLEHRIKAQCYGLGFDLVGIAALGPADTSHAFDAWIARGFAGEMHYLPRWAEKRRDSRLPAPGTKSAIVVAVNYGGTRPVGPIARYARGDDYHDVMLAKLQELHQWIDGQLRRPTRAKAYVDTGPLLERDLARRAGLGWFGKNTNLINPDIGSFFFLGALLIDLVLEPDAPFEADRCGSCTRCLDACPTGAFAEPRVLDSTRCISYLTIEAKGAIPETLREALGTLVYGCDICQDVCPWNVRFARDVTLPTLASRPGMDEPDIPALLGMDDETFRRQFRGSAIKRAKRRGLARNAAVALGNRRDPADIPALARALAEDPEPLVRAHAAWALGRFPGVAEAQDALTVALWSETDEAVRREIQAAMGGTPAHSIGARADLTWTKPELRP